MCKKSNGNGNGKAKGKVGAIEKIIDWPLVDRLLEGGCLGSEIAATLGIHFDTLADHVKKYKGMNFTHYSQIKRQKGCQHLRMLQNELADDKDRGMLIWLGKQRLKQKDKPDESIEDMNKDLDYLMRKIEAYRKLNETSGDTVQ